MKHFTVTGMSCAACSTRVEKAVSAVNNVTSCNVSLLTNSMVVEGTATDGEIIQAVENAGYKAYLKNGETKNQSLNEQNLSKNETSGLLKRLVFSLVFLIVLMYISMGHTMWGWPLPGFLASNHIAMGLCQLLLAAAIMVINQKFFISGFKGLINKAPNMDTLVSLGSAAAFVYSTYALFAMTSTDSPEKVMHYMHEFYFESAAMILTLITLGKLLEAYAKGRTTNALKGLMDLSPKTAVIIKDEKEITVPVEQVQVGDIFAVRAGDRVPVDGIIISGDSAFDESSLTGESLPVDKSVGDNVSAGTFQKSGYVVCRATKVGSDTTLSGIIRMVSDAAAGKAPIAKVADKVSGVFVPVVLAIAAITFIVWMLANQSVGFALARGISVLVISCPCALGLATPVAIMVGNGVGAKQGILFKTAESLEQTGKVKTVVLDKTGTVTQGKPQVTNVIAAKGIGQAELVQLAYDIEKQSEHPLAGAVVDYAEKNGFTANRVDNFKVFPGNGINAVLNNNAVYGGNYDYIIQHAIVDDQLVKAAAELSDKGKTPLFFAKQNKCVGVIAVTDTIKPDSPSAIANLKAMGIDVVMLTGDNEKTARAMAKQAGLTNVIAGVLPDQKKYHVNSFKKHGRVAMVGDGINDAPALTSADIGIAIGAGTDIAIDAADVVLMKSRLSDVVTAIELSRATLRNIHENLFWAFIYNIIGIPLATGALIPVFHLQLNPMFAAAAMSFSSFCVVTNALRLNLFSAGRRHKKTGKTDGPDSTITNNKEISNEGVKNMIKTIEVEGMMCSHCEAHVKKELETVAGVKSAKADHSSGKVELVIDGDVSDTDIKNAVERAGYKLK